jgi:hypothetical protein
MRSAVDTRRVELSLTARGRAVQQKTPATVAQTRLADALARLSPADASMLARTLKSVVTMMGETEEEPAPMLFDERPPAAMSGNRAPRGSASATVAKRGREKGGS